MTPKMKKLRTDARKYFRGLYLNRKFVRYMLMYRNEGRKFLCLAADSAILKNIDWLWDYKQFVAAMTLFQATQGILKNSYLDALEKFTGDDDADELREYIMELLKEDAR